MKTLLLLRHAKSSWKEKGQADHDRPLKKRGKREAERVGGVLRAADLLPALTLSSTARRARKTARIVLEAAGCDAPLELHADLYLAEPPAYLARLAGLSDETARVLVVGHNPRISEFVHHLTGHAEEMPTACLVRIDLPIERWQGLNGSTHGELVQTWRPRVSED